MRSSHTKIRETIALIQQGSGKIYGVVNIIDSIGPFSDEEMIATKEKHQITPDRLNRPEELKWRYAWVLSDAKRLLTPISYTHKSGAVDFVRLDRAWNLSTMEKLTQAICNNEFTTTK